MARRTKKAIRARTIAGAFVMILGTLISVPIAALAIVIGRIRELINGKNSRDSCRAFDRNLVPLGAERGRGVGPTERGSYRSVGAGAVGDRDGQGTGKLGSD